MLQIFSQASDLIFSQNTFTYTGNYMGGRVVSATVLSPSILPLVSGCYADYRGERFYLYDTPSIKKVASQHSKLDAFQYDVRMYTCQKELGLVSFMDIVPADSTAYFTGSPTVEFVGDITYLAGRIQANLDEVFSGDKAWTVNIHESITSSDTVSISLTDSSVWDALTLVNTEQNWGYNFTVKNRVITIGTNGSDIPTTFQYGKGGGLYELSRTNVDSSNIITRLRAYGGTTNIPEDYLKVGDGNVAPIYQNIKELQLPQVCHIEGATVNAESKGNWDNGTSYSEGSLVKYTDGNRYYCYDAAPAGTEPTNVLYFTPWPTDYIESESGIQAFGIREGIYRNEAIFPTIKGMTIGEITSNPLNTTRVDEILACSKILSGAQATFYIWVRDIGFNINEYTTSETPTISITSGRNLVGFNFEIKAVVEDTTTISGCKYKLTLARSSEEKQVLPDMISNIYRVESSGILIPAIGESLASFVILGISLPQVYISAAAQRLLVDATDKLLVKSQSQVSYSLMIDEIEMARNRQDSVGDVIAEGDTLGVYDPNLGIGASLASPKRIIIQNLTITEGESIIPSYTVTLSDTPIASTIGGIKSGVEDNSKKSEIIKREVAGVDSIANSALVSAKGADYLKLALGENTSIEGGLFGTTLIQVKDTDDNVTGGLSGLKEDNVLLFSGSYQDALDSISKILLRKDGSGQLAGGKILWDTYANTTISALIRTAENGARVEIDPVRRSVITYDTAGLAVSKVSNEEVASITQIQLPATGSKTHSDVFFRSDANSNAGVVTNGYMVFTFSIPKGRYYNVTLPSINRNLLANSGVASGQFSRSRATMFLVNTGTDEPWLEETLGEVYSNSNVDVQSNASVTPQVAYNIPGGDYGIFITLYCENSHADGYSSASSSINIGNAASWVGAVKFTEIGSNGANFVVSATDYLHKSDGITQVRNGNYAFRVTSSGIQKSSDGGSNWTSI